VPVDQRIALYQLGHALDAVVEARPPHVPVREEEMPSAVDQFGVIAHAREVEHHLVDLGIAVAAHGHHLRGDAVEHLDNALGGVVLGQVVARTVIELISEQHHAVGALVLDRLHELGAPIGGAVDIGCDDELHRIASISVRLTCMPMAS
jgi:hypothetical protein